MSVLTRHQNNRNLQCGRVVGLESRDGEMNSPMLCQPWDGKPRSGRWIAEPKIDGVRALIEIDSLGASFIISRNGKPLYNWDTIKAELKARNVTNVVLDGEIYDGRSFDSTSGILRTQYTHPAQKSLTYH